MGHYASEMGWTRDGGFSNWLRVRNENDYQNIAYTTDRNPEDTLVHHLPCGLAVANMVKHLEYCPAKETS